MADNEIMRYPASEITPAGWWVFATGRKPLMQLKAWDKSITFQLLGGLAPPYNDPTTPEAVELKDLSGLIPPWKHVQQKGAVQDGITHIDALYDPCEVKLKVECVGKGWRNKSKVVRDLIAAIDAKEQSELGFFDKWNGYWWSNVRWFQGAPDDALDVVHSGQPLSLRLQADDALWRSYDHTDQFSFSYVSTVDGFNEFDTYDDGDLGPYWPLYYYAPGGGYIFQSHGQAKWKDDPDDWLITQTRDVVCGPYAPGGVTFETNTDYQVVNMRFTRMQEWSLPAGAANDLWARMGSNPDGTWDGNGIRLRLENNVMRLSRFNNFHETLMRWQVFLIPPLVGDVWALVAGYEGNARIFKVTRNGITVLSHKENGTASMMGPDYRGVGFGMQAGAALITQATPGFLGGFWAGDNGTVSQEGYLERVNIGDQPMYDDYTLFGPGKFKIYDGPDSTDFVEFGPLLDNQIVYLRTDPRSNTTLVQDLTVVPPSPQALTAFQKAIKQLVSFFSGRSAMTDQIFNTFGIRTPQGNMYKYLSGRFSDHAAIPPKSPGAKAKPYYVKVAIDNGNADSKIIVSGTPKRRYPL